jgi:hypothetical protein
MKKIMLLIFTLGTLLVAQEPSDCKEVMTQQFGGYIVKRQEFYRDHDCIMPSSEIIVNKETNQTVELDGFVTGMESTYLDEKDILKVNYHAGAHTHVVEFFTVAKNGNLSRIEGGAIGSDLGDPAVYLDSFKNVLVVFQRYVDETFHKGKPCRKQVEKVYEYKNNKFSKIVENSMMASECEE